MALILEPRMLVCTASAIGFELMDDVVESRRLAMRARHRWSTEVAGPTRAAHIHLPDADVLWGLIEDALAHGTTDLRLVDTGSGVSPTESQLALRQLLRRDLITTLPDPLTAASVGDGAVCLRHVQGRHPSLADLADELALAFDAHVELTLIAGRSSPSHLTLAGHNRTFVMAVSGGVELEASDVEAAVRVEQGHVAQVIADHSLGTDADGLALLIDLMVPTVSDLWRAVVMKAGYTPQFRGGMPVEPDSPVEVFGRSDRVDVRSLLRSGLVDLLDAEAATEALAAWRATLVPAARRMPVRSWIARTGVANEDSIVRGRFPGGVGFLSKEPHPRRRTACAGAWAFRLLPAEHEVLEVLLSDTYVPFSSVPRDGRDLVERLITLGLAEVT